MALELDAVIDASGDAGGGTVLVGGAFQGKGPEPNAERSFVGSDAEIHADALTDGDGGTVIVWADEFTEFFGEITARGGSEGGDGGFVEVSGKRHLAFNGRVDAAAPFGLNGTLLLDPLNVLIQDGEAGALIGGVFTASTGDAGIAPDAIETALSGSTDVTINTGTDGAEDGDITVVDDIAINSGTATLTLNAADDIVVNDFIEATGTAQLSVALNANTTAGGVNNDPDPSAGNVDINAAITTNGGTFTSTGVDFDNTGGDISTSGGDITVDHTGTIAIGGAQNAGAGDVSLISGGAVTDGGSGVITAGGLRVTAAGATLDNVSNNVTTLAAEMTGDGNGFVFTGEADGFTVATVDGVTGIITEDSSSGSGDIALSSAGTIGIDAAIATGSDTVSASGGPDAARTGFISVTSTGGAITGDAAGTLTTGAAVVDGSDAAADSATSGNITLTADGEIQLAAADAVAIGLATVTSAGAGDAATTGTIALSADKVTSNGLTGRVDVSFGQASGGSATSGVLTVTTDGGADEAGGVFVTSAEDLRLGGFDTANGSGQTVDIEVTGGAALTSFANPSNLDSDDITLAADAMEIVADITTTGIVTLAESTSGQEIDVGSETLGSLSLTDAELGLINDAAALRIGSTNAGAITITAAVSPGTDVTDISLISGATVANDAPSSSITASGLNIDLGRRDPRQYRQRCHRVGCHDEPPTPTSSSSATPMASPWPKSTAFSASTGLTAAGIRERRHAEYRIPWIRRGDHHCRRHGRPDRYRQRHRQQYVDIDVTAGNLIIDAGRCSGLATGWRPRFPTWRQTVDTSGIDLVNTGDLTITTVARNDACIAPVVGIDLDRRYSRHIPRRARSRSTRRSPRSALTTCNADRDRRTSRSMPASAQITGTLAPGLPTVIVLAPVIGTDDLTINQALTTIGGTVDLDSANISSDGRRYHHDDRFGQ